MAPAMGVRSGIAWSIGIRILATQPKQVQRAQGAEANRGDQKGQTGGAHCFDGRELLPRPGHTGLFHRGLHAERGLERINQASRGHVSRKDAGADQGVQQSNRGKGK